MVDFLIAWIIFCILFFSMVWVSFYFFNTNKGTAILRRILFGKKILYFTGRVDNKVIAFISNLYTIDEWKIAYRYNASKVGSVEITDDDNAIYSNCKLSYREISIKDAFCVTEA